MTMPTRTIPVSHFQLDDIANSGQVFRWRQLEPGGYLLLSGRRAAVARQPQENLLELTCPPQDTAFWTHYLALDDDYDSIWQVLEHWADIDGPNAYLTRAVRAGRGLRILHQEPFESTVSFIVSQNNNIPRIRKILELLCRRLGPVIVQPPLQPAPGGPLYGFPCAQRLRCAAQLQGLGLGYRDTYVACAAAAFSGALAPLRKLPRMSREQARSTLLSLHGVGPKVADCIILFGLGHLDAFPKDVWIGRILNREFPQGFPLPRYAGFAGLLQQMLFFYERQQQGLVPPAGTSAQPAPPPRGPAHGHAAQTPRACSKSS